MGSPDASRTLARLGLSGIASARSEDHPDAEILLAHAGNELAEEEALDVTRHLVTCSDGSCAAVVRDAIASAEVARVALFGGRHDFACPDPLWQAFASLAEREGSSVDAMLVDAMRAFMEQRSVPGSVRARREPVRVSVWDGPSSMADRNTPTMQRSYLPRAPASAWRRSDPGQEPRSEPSSAANVTSAPPVSGVLRVVTGGVRYEVTKSRFVVGRGGPASDLAIDDPGVSRQHAVIERGPRGEYVLVDMGSTNGVEFQGERIARKEIAHGDRFRIGEAELEFFFG